ncbi:hypothetical protein M413DRAFT_408231 [Hebeloma cylindrosporum]|uniref:Alpha-type protein kinase domain-containing protein n=1 Tax=Hebeloma cylindrosporum TaxID=76867 RepID=A0A0C3CME1_HEBCY|nr:hypothetical protein M413DRAFT_408231 [Hebeloma cylindrosporum h7]
MTTCVQCQHTFPLLEGGNCGKCNARKPGMSSTDLAAVNVIPQCAACGLVSRSLENAICNFCVKHYKNTGSVHTSILGLAGVAELVRPSQGHGAALMSEGLTQSEHSSMAERVIDSARAFQPEASGPRFAHPAEINAQAGLSLKNLGRATQVKLERKQKTQEAKLLDTGIRVSATLWQSNNNKIAQISDIRNIGRFDPQVSTKSALDQLLVGVRTDFEKKYPEATQLTWANISYHAHESQSKFYSLANFDRNQPISQLLKMEFVMKRIGSQRNLENREIEIRFMFETKNVVRSSESFSTGLGSKRKRNTHAASSRRTASMTSKAPLSASHSAFPPPQRKSAAQPVRLRSAFPPIFPPPPRPPQWTRSVDTTSYAFIRTTATFVTNGKETGQVIFSQGDDSDEEFIEIPSRSAWEQKGAIGYIGEGFTKRGIYARFCGKEYVITQPVDNTTEEVEHVLTEEYKLLCLGNALKAVFDDHALELGAKTIPSFYFNFESSILGRLVPSASSQSCPLPHRIFIATPLLPCGDADPKVKKFTGNDSIGPANDDMTKAIHAFAHFSAIYSSRRLLLCDLQGKPYVSPHLSEMTLYLNFSSCGCRTQPSVYWDGGSAKIDEFLAQHSPSCADNWVCRALKLQDIVVFHDSDANNSPPKKKARDARQSLDYITHPKI